MTSYVFLVRYVTSEEGQFREEYAFIATPHEDGPTMRDALGSHPDPASMIECHVIEGPFWSEVTA